MLKKSFTLTTFGAFLRGSFLNKKFKKVICNIYTRNSQTFFLKVPLEEFKKAVAPFNKIYKKNYS